MGPLLRVTNTRVLGSSPALHFYRLFSYGHTVVFSFHFSMGGGRKNTYFLITVYKVFLFVRYEKVEEFE